MEDKQKDRLKRAREEKERINGMLERGVPKAKPFTATQLADQEIKKQRLVDERIKRVEEQKELEERQNQEK
jgi:hypothetical protein